MFKKYIEYRRNKKIVKCELAKVMATTLPLVNELLENSSRTGEIAKYIAGLSPEDMEKIIVSAQVDTLKDNK